MEFLAELHPHIIHFPIALFITYSLIEFFGIIFKIELALKTAYIILSIAVVSAFCAAISGNEALNTYADWDEVTLPVAENHQLYANLTIWYFTILLVIRTVLVAKKKFNSKLKYIFLIFIPVGIYFVYQAGKYGGELMHKHGIGTEFKLNQSSID